MDDPLTASDDDRDRGRPRDSGFATTATASVADVADCDSSQVIICLESETQEFEQGRGTDELEAVRRSHKAEAARWRSLTL